MAVLLSSCSCLRTGTPEETNTVKLEFKVQGNPSAVEVYAEKIEKKLTSLGGVEALKSTSSDGNLTILVKSKNTEEIQEAVELFLKENPEISQNKD